MQDVWVVRGHSEQSLNVLNLFRKLLKLSCTEEDSLELLLTIWSGLGNLFGEGSWAGH